MQPNPAPSQAHLAEVSPADGDEIHLISAEVLNKG